MSWRRKNRVKGKNEYYSLINKLRKEGKSNEEFELFLNNLTLEEVLGLKLDLAATTLLDGKMYGLPVWSKMTNIIRESLLRYALSATKSKLEAARFLGITQALLFELMKRYDVDSYYEKETPTDD